MKILVISARYVQVPFMYIVKKLTVKVTFVMVMVGSKKNFKDKGCVYIESTW